MLGLTMDIFISRVVVLIVAFTIHEFAHAWTATQFGDETPRQYGRLTLNPLAHLDPLGSLLLLVVGFGWAKPVPVNPYVLQRRSSSALMWVSLAGPLSNLLMAVLAAVPFQVGLLSQYNSGPLNRFLPSPGEIGIIFIEINLLLMLFNLIPLAPLDGEKVAEYFFPPNLARAWDTIRPYGPIILLLVAFVGPTLGFPILTWIIDPPMRVMLRLLGFHVL